MAEYTLPDLPYDYAALEPHVSAQIMELHHDKHHAAYVTGANQTLEKLAAARDKDDFGAIVGMEKTLAFHISGHVLHSIFWNNQSPDGGDKPDGALGAAIDEALVVDTEQSLMKLSDAVGAAYLSNNERSEAVWEALA